MPRSNGGVCDNKLSVERLPANFLKIFLSYFNKLMYSVEFEGDFARASCSTLRSCLLNLSRKVGRFGKFEYIPYLCFDDYNFKSLLPKQVDASLLVQTFKVNFKTQLNTRKNFAGV